MSSGAVAMAGIGQTLHALIIVGEALVEVTAVGRTYELLGRRACEALYDVLYDAYDNQRHDDGEDEGEELGHIQLRLQGKGEEFG